jgi:two-component system, NtrC family, sensor kinase
MQGDGNHEPDRREPPEPDTGGGKGAPLHGDVRDLPGRLDEVEGLLRESRARLAQAEKMAELGNLVAGIAHEMNTPLASISSNTDTIALVLQKLRGLIVSGFPDEASPVRRQFEESLSIAAESLRTSRLACDRILKLVGALRGFVRHDDLRMQEADVHAGIESTLAIIAHELKGRIKVVKEYGDLPEIECYPDQLNQVFMNLLVNAAQAIAGQGEIRIRTCLDGDTIRISISDSGSGIPADLTSKVFDSGFTTKKAGEGTGLGLSISNRIVRAHGGRIELDGGAGRGATFTVVLPVRTTEERKKNEH